jgi:hypothetical protein
MRRLSKGLEMVGSRGSGSLEVCLKAVGEVSGGSG